MQSKPAVKVKKGEKKQKGIEKRMQLSKRDVLETKNLFELLMCSITTGFYTGIWAILYITLCGGAYDELEINIFSFLYNRNIYH